MKSEDKYWGRTARKKWSNLCSHSRQSSLQDLGGINNSQDVLQTWISIIPRQTTRVQAMECITNVMFCIWVYSLPLFVDRPSLQEHHNTTATTGPVQPQVSPTALSFLTRPVVSVDHICRTTLYCTLYSLATLRYCTGPDIYQYQWFVMWR